VAALRLGGDGVDGLDKDCVAGVGGEEQLDGGLAAWGRAVIRAKVQQAGLSGVNWTKGKGNANRRDSEAEQIWNSFHRK
jgi:hypothetical protein